MLDDDADDDVRWCEIMMMTRLWEGIVRRKSPETSLEALAARCPGGTSDENTKVHDEHENTSQTQYMETTRVAHQIAKHIVANIQ